MKSNTLNIKANQLIAKRDNLTTEIARYWKIIKTENVLKKNLKRNYDLKQLLIHIIALYDDLVLVKLKIQCVNMGMKLKNLPKDANIINIYKLSAQNEYFVKLGEIIKDHTINPILKAKKGKKALAVSEELTRSYLKARQNECSLTLNELRKKIADFNDNTDVEDDSTPLFLAA